MTGSPRTGAVLYSRELLALAVALADVPFDPDLPLIGEARSRTCGSTLRLSASLDGDGRFDRFGLRVSACAVGQAAAALFARGAVGRSAADVAVSREQIASWLAQGVPPPDWPGLAALEPARAYPARHGAILLAWDAALAALSNAEVRG